MVNDLLNECYMVFRVRHMLHSAERCLTIDKYCLSEVIAITPQISVSVALDGRKRLVFRPFRKISTRIGGIWTVMRAAHGHPPHPSECAFLCNYSLRRQPLTPPLRRTPQFSGISAADGRQSEFHAGYGPMPVRRRISSLTGLHLGSKTRLQLVIFSRILYLYKHLKIA